MIAPLLIASLALAKGSTPAEDFAWIEGENPTSSNVKGNAAGWGRADLLSGGKWLHISLEGNAIAKNLPPEGGKLSYSFKTTQSGDHEIWDRIGYEFVRSAFDWRVDGGDWKRINPDDLTTDLQELETWNEVAWIKLGKSNLKAGDHTLEIRLPYQKNEKGELQRVLYATDALIITSKPFTPNGKFKPGEKFQTDQDIAAANYKFALPDAKGVERQTVSLNGIWEICRDDEQTPGEVATPMSPISENPSWTSIPVPSDRNVTRPDLIFAHRLWYRTRVSVPANQVGRSFFIDFPQNNLNTTVYVNGQLCGFNKNPYAQFQIDVTKAMKAGDNEIKVGIRDAWYGFATNPKNPLKLRKSFNIPLSFTSKGFSDFAYPVWNAMGSGILETPSLVSAGSVRVADVFVKPSVKSHRLNAEITLRNTRTSEVQAKVKIEAIDPVNGSVVKEIATSTIPVGAGSEVSTELTGPWENPELWWPDRPRLYHLRTTVEAGGSPVDVSNTPFGFREWEWSGKDFKLNGMVWHGWAELTQGSTPESYLKNYRNHGQRLIRYAGNAQNGNSSYFLGMDHQKALDWMDQNGIVVRRSNVLDGEAIGYMAIETDPDLKSLYGTEVKVQLMQNWRDQVVAQVKAERNHPSIHLWSLENEWLYINCINLYGNLMDEFENEVNKTGLAVAKVDPTRPWMTDGGGAGKANLFPVHGDHYIYTGDPSAYPDLAYQIFPEGGGRGRWQWDQKRPRYAGEDYFASGINPADYAWIAGEEAFQGKLAAQRGMALVQRMLTEGYRWGGHMGAWHLWLGDEGAQFDKYIPNAERAAFVRQYDWTFGSGQNVKRTIGIFNDSRFDEPLTLKTAVKLNGEEVYTATKLYTVKPGENQKFDLSFKAPKVSKRTEATYELSLEANGKIVFKDSKPLSILPPTPTVAFKPGTLAVIDPEGSLKRYLSTAGISFVSATLNAIPPTAEVLIVGRNALSETDSTQSTLSAFAVPGRRVIVLDQAHPLHFQGLPVEMETTTSKGAFAFPEDLTHPIFAGLAEKDFFTWGDDGIVYRNAYQKANRGAKSFIQAHSRLTLTPLTEIPVGPGLLVLSQLTIGEKLATNATAQRLLVNLLTYAKSYRQEFQPVVAVTTGNSQLASALNAIGLKHSEASDALTPLLSKTPQIVVINASPANLKRLASNLPTVQSFISAGGTIVFNGLTPEGLADYNQIVGANHMIRPFRRERTSLATPKHPLTSGLSLGDVVMLSSERMFDFNSDMFVASDIFSYIVDVDDVAPFAKLDNDYLYNTTNGFVSSDGWKYIFSFDLNNQKPEYEMAYDRPMEFTEIEWVGNAFYHLVTKFELVFDGKDHVVFDVKPGNDAQTLPIAPGHRGSKVTLRILEWQKVPANGGNVVGIDNIRLRVKRDPAFTKSVRALMNIGGLVEYNRGKGRFILANLLLKDQESVPENKGKKLRILSAVMRNLKAPFSDGKTIIPGAVGNQYSSIDIGKQANQFRNEKGWFGDSKFNFGEFPTGKQVFAGIPFTVYEFATSPVPNAIMLGGDGVPGNLKEEVKGIPVNQVASALFFLQAARIDQRRPSNGEDATKKYEMARYLVHYADGQTLTIPLYSEIDLENYRQEKPKQIPGAQLAWTRPYSGTNESAVAYIKQWNNPRPDVKITSIDLTYGPDRRGIPALLAITAAK